MISLTLTSHSSIFKVRAVSCTGIIGTVYQSIFKSLASHIIKEDGASALAKSSKLKSSSIYSEKKLASSLAPNLKNACNHTMFGVSQLLAGYSSIRSSPEVITDCAPHSIHADLHSAFILSCSSN